MWAQDWITCRADRDSVTFPEPREKVPPEREWKSPLKGPGCLQALPFPESDGNTDLNEPLQPGEGPRQAAARPQVEMRVSEAVRAAVGRSRWEDPVFRPSTARGQRDCPRQPCPVNLSRTCIG